MQSAKRNVDSAKKASIKSSSKSYNYLKVNLPDSPSESESARMPSPPHLTCEPVEVEIHFEPPPSYEEALSNMTVDKRRKTH